MRLLLDSCVWGKSCTKLEAAGHDVVAVADWPVDPGDEEILEFAQKENRILVTLDKDFGDLAVLQRKPHHGIIRLVNIPARQQAAVSLRILSTCEADLRAGGIVTVSETSLRIRTPD